MTNFFVSFGPGDGGVVVELELEPPPKNDITLRFSMKRSSTKVQKLFRSTKSQMLSLTLHLPHIPIETKPLHVAFVSIQIPS
jgi:hypothetical protein